MTDATEADLEWAKATVGTLLENRGLTAHLYAVEPKEGKRAIIVECATDSGWHRTELQQVPNSWTRSAATRKPERLCSPNGECIWPPAKLTDAACQG